MKNQLVVLAIVAGALAASSCAAAPLTRDAAVKLALGANPALRAAAAEVAAQDGALMQARALPNPELEILREGQDRSNRTTTAQLGIPFELGGKRAAREDAARREQEVASIALEAVRMRIRADAVAAFYEVLAASEQLRLAQELATLAQRAESAAARRVEAGKAPPLEATRAKVAQANARIETLQAARDLESARIRLAALWGGKAAEIEVAAPGSIELPPSVPLEQLSARLAQAPDVRRAQADIARHAALARVERSKQTPDLTLIVGTRREYPDDRQQAVLGVSVLLPLFNRNQGALLASLRRTDKARDEALAEQTRLHAELAQAHARLTAARDEAALIEAEIVPGAQSAFTAASRGYELGKFGLLDVLDAQRAFFQARHQYLQAVAESHRAAADIERLVGPSAQETP